jgi:hypothetical protein
MKKEYLSKIIIAVTIIITAIILSSAYINRNKAQNIISVTGMAQEDFVSDLITWNASFEVKDMDLTKAYADLKKTMETVKTTLINKGVNPKEITFSAVDIRKQYRTVYDEKRNSTSIFDGYRLQQTVSISSHEVDKIEVVSREITELINVGIEITSYSPEYYYTKLSELKIRMLSDAAKDANLRATTIAENGGGKIGKLKVSSMGVFQITGQNSSEEYSWGGSFNTSSKNKTASITVRFEYELK